VAIRTIASAHVVELLHHGESEGILASEAVEVRVVDEGGGPFLAIKGRNMQPTDDYDSHTVTLEMEDIKSLCDALCNILKQAEVK